MAARANRGRLRLVEPAGSTPSPGPTTVPTMPPGSGVQQVSASTTPVPVPVTVPATVTTGAAGTQATPFPAPFPGQAEAVAARPPQSSSPSIAEIPTSRAQFAALSDAQLVTLGCRGETRALEVLYRRHASFAIHLAARIEGSSRDVEDIAHDAFLRAFERLDDLTDRGAFRSWLGSIVVHAVRSRMRRHRLMSILGLKTAEPVDLDALASPDASPHIRAQIAQIYALLRTLPTDERIAWVLRCVEGHDLETVARLTRCSLATVKRRISRAQKFLDEHFVDPDVSPDASPDVALHTPNAPNAPHPLHAPSDPNTSGAADSNTGAGGALPSPHADAIEDVPS